RECGSCRQYRLPKQHRQIEATCTAAEAPAPGRSSRRSEKTAIDTASATDAIVRTPKLRRPSRPAKYPGEIGTHSPIAHFDRQESLTAGGQNLFSKNRLLSCFCKNGEWPWRLRKMSAPGATSAEPHMKVTRLLLITLVVAGLASPAPARL